MTADRRATINQYIQSRGEIRFKELEERYPGVSSMTLRRDLEFLERQGRIIRIRGGAKSLAHLSMIKEAAYTQRQVENTDAKMIIAEKAIQLIHEGQSIYVDSGTTCMCLAQRMKDQHLFVLTPAPNIALELVKNQNIKINLTGGQLNRDTLTLSGFNAVKYVKTLNIDLAFMAPSAFTVQNGFSCGDYFEAELKRLVIRKARQVVMLIDSSKLDRNMPHTFAKLQNLYALITDKPLPEAYIKSVRRAHVLSL